MGTRSLIAAIVGNEYKIAQYSQWDGYPRGAGVEILEFIQSTDMEKFKQSVKKCTFINSPIMIEKRWEEMKFAWSRDIGSDIYKLVLEHDGLELVNDSEFLEDSLFCEYAYIINFDTSKLEFYIGLQKKPPKGKLAGCKPGKEGYYGCSLEAEMPFSEIKRDMKQALNRLSTKDNQ